MKNKCVLIMYIIHIPYICIYLYIWFNTIQIWWLDKTVNYKSADKGIHLCKFVLKCFYSDINQKCWMRWRNVEFCEFHNKEINFFIVIDLEKLSIYYITSWPKDRAGSWENSISLWCIANPAYADSLKKKGTRARQQQIGYHRVGLNHPGFSGLSAK